MSGSAHYLEPKFLSELAYEVAALESVSKDLKEADLTKEKLVEEILKEPELSESIKVAISDKVAQADGLEKEIDNLQHQIRDFGQIANSGFKETTDSSVWWYIALYVLTLGFLLAALLSSFLRLEFWAPVLMVLVPCVWIAFSVLGLFMIKAPKVVRQLAHDEPGASRAQIEQRIKMATSEQHENLLEIPKTIRDDVLTPIARKILERLIMPSYELVLQGEAAPLGEVWDPRYETETKPRKELERQLSLMSGGSIGISGSRGAGKTTLIKYFCRRSDGKSTSHKRPVLGFWTPAPARYEARDFVLHLFGKLCEIVRTEVVGHSVLEDENRRTQTNNPALLALLPFTRAINVLGNLLLCVSAIGIVIRTELIVVPHHDAALQKYPVLVSRYPLYRLSDPVPALFSSSIQPADAADPRDGAVGRHLPPNLRNTWSELGSILSNGLRAVGNWLGRANVQHQAESRQASSFSQ